MRVSYFRKLKVVPKFRSRQTKELLGVLNQLKVQSIYCKVLKGLLPWKIFLVIVIQNEIYHPITSCQPHNHVMTFMFCVFYVNVPLKMFNILLLSESVWRAISCLVLALFYPFTLRVRGCVHRYKVYYSRDWLYYPLLLVNILQLTLTPHRDDKNKIMFKWICSKNLWPF